MSERPIVVLGADGMLGTAWMKLLEERGIPARPATEPALDITDPASIARFVDTETRAVVNCAAYTNVDGAEEHEALATKVNGDAVALLVARCDELGIPLVHYSTDYVFDGQGDAPYPVDHPTDPVNAYGRSKRVGEAHVAASDGPHLVIRTSWLYAPWGKNFVKTIARYAKERDSLKVVNDQRGRPTSAEHLARTSLALLEGGHRGFFHGTDGGECTWYDFAKAIAEHADPSCVVSPCTSEEYPLPAKRPAYSVLDISKTEAAVGPLVPWTDALASVLPRLS